jgi:hypothetical protein
MDKLVNDIPFGHKRCGFCGSIAPLEQFKVQSAQLSRRSYFAGAASHWTAINA